MARKPRLTQQATPDEVQGRDLFLTPRYATELIVPFIKTQYVWECAAGEGYITTVLKEKGFTVISTDLRENKNLGVSKWNFLDHFSSSVMSGLEDNYSIVTNPPYSLKKEFAFKAIELNVPFAFLISADICGWIIDAIKNYGCEKLIPERRIDYITPNHLSRLNAGEGTNYTDLRQVDPKIIRKYNGSYFHSMWLTRYMDLGAVEIYSELSNEDKDRIF